MGKGDRDYCLTRLNSDHLLVCRGGPYASDIVIDGVGRRDVFEGEDGHKTRHGQVSNLPATEPIQLSERNAQMNNWGVVSRNWFSNLTGLKTAA